MRAAIDPDFVVIPSIRFETRELRDTPEAELDELTRIYTQRGLDSELARQVATQLMARGALAAHARDELGISDMVAANPIQAALVSALTFAAGGVFPLLVALLAPASQEYFRTRVSPAVNPAPIESPPEQE